MGKPVRYRVTFTMGGKEYTVIPDFQYIDHVEQSIESQYKIGRNLETGNYRHSEIAHVIHSALVTAGYNDLTYQDVGQLVMDELGLSDASIIAGQIVMASQNVNPENLRVKLSDGEEVTPEEAEGKEHAGQPQE